MAEIELRGPIRVRITLVCDCGRRADRTLTLGGPANTGTIDSSTAGYNCVRACGRRHTIVLDGGSVPITVRTDGPVTGEVAS